MSGKFMKVRKICVSTLTMLIIASQLCGCASSTQKEMLNMYNNNQSITIEVAEPISQEQGERREYEWVELASLDTYSDFRMTVDDIMGITTHGTDGKNGVIYVNLEGNHTNNSTLKLAFSNQKFLDNVWNNSDSMENILEATRNNYADIETDAMAKVAFLNAYFNIFADAEPNYFNGNQTLTRAEFLGGVFRTISPVYEITLGTEFGAAVDPDGTIDDTVFAEKIEEYSYLTTEYSNLNEDTFEGTITRAEAIYTLVKMFYADEFNATQGNEKVSYTDAKNGGNIAKECGFITIDKETGTTTYRDLWKTYELSYALQTADNGLPTELYRALVVAENHGIITGTTSRWDEGITKNEALSIIVKVFEDLGTVNNVERGSNIGEVINNSTANETTNTVEDGESVETEGYSAELLEYLRGFDFFATAPEETIIDYLNMFSDAYDFQNMTQEEIDAFVDMLNNEFPGTKLEDFWGETVPSGGSTGGNSGGNSGNGGGGSTPVVSPEDNQSGVPEEDFITPEIDNPDGGNNEGSSGNNSGTGNGNPLFNYEDGGDGGPLTGDVTLNP